MWLEIDIVGAAPFLLFVANYSCSLIQLASRSVEPPFSV